MKRLFGLLAVSSVLVGAACGGGDDDDDNGGPDAGAAANPGFILPPAGEFPQAYLEVGGVWELQGDADFSCLNTPTDDVVSDVDIQLSGTTTDFQTGDVVDNVELAAFPLGASLSGTPVATATSDGAGAYSMTLPKDTAARWTFRSTDPEGSRFLDTYLMNQYFDPSAAGHPDHDLDLSSVSFLTANALPAFIGVMRTEGLGVLAGAFRDCQGREVDGVIATVNAESCAAGTCDPANLKHLDGAQTYYFSAGSTSLPVRHSQAPNTNHDGLFVVIELPPSSEAFLQVWGYATQADADAQKLSLLGEIPAPVLADSVITASMEPLRTAN